MSMADLDKALGQKQALAWWRSKEAHLATDVVTAFRHIRNSQAYRFSADLLHLQLYSDLRYVGLWPDVLVQGLGDLLSGRIQENMVRVIVDTAHAKLTKPRPMPRVLTDGANYDIQDQSELLEKWIAGKFHMERLWDKRSQVIKHACVTGTGAYKVYADVDAGEARIDVAPSWEIWADAMESRYGADDLRTWYQVRTMPIEQAIEKWPKSADAIVSAPRMTYGDELASYSAVRDSALCQIVEAWHLGKDGRRIVCVDDAKGKLEEDDWRERKPFIMQRYCSRPWGIWGVGIPESLAGSQLELQRLLSATQEALRRFMPFVAVERGAKIVKQHIQNLIGYIIEYTGTPPQIVAPSPIPPEWWKQRAEIKQGMYESTRISQMSAGGQVPAGFKSGKAMRTYADIESEGLIEPTRADEQAMIEVAEQLIEVQRELGEDAKGVVQLMETDSVATIRWQEIDIAADAYKIHVAPASVLANTVAGKMEDIGDLQSLGVQLEGDQVLDLMQIPDLRKWTNVRMARRRIIQRIVEGRILGKGVYVEPEPTWDMRLCKQIASDALLYAQETYYRRFDEFDEEQRTEIEQRHDLVRQFIAAAMARLPPPEGTMGTEVTQQMPAGAPPVPGATALGPPLAPAPTNGAPPALATAPMAPGVM